MKIGKKLLSTFIAINIALTALPTVVSNADTIRPNEISNTTAESSHTLAHETLINGAAFTFKNVNSGLYMGIADVCLDRNITQREMDDIYYNTVFKLESAGDGYYYIIYYINNRAAYVLEASDDGNICYDIFEGNDAQKFMFTANNDGTYKIHSKITDCISCIDVQDASTQAEANIQLNTESSSESQNWILDTASVSGCEMDSTIKYAFKNKGSGLVMNVEKTEIPELDEFYYSLVLEEDKGINNQIWTLDPFDHRYNVYNNYYIDASRSISLGRIDERINILFAMEYDYDYEEFRNKCLVCRFSKNLDGTYCIITHDKKYNDLYFEVKDTGEENNAYVSLNTINGKDDQKWIAITQATTQATTTTTTTTTTTATSSSTATNTSSSSSSTTVTTATTTAEPVTVDIHYGDVDLNGMVDLADVTTLAKYLLSSVAYPFENDKAYLNADVTHDEIVDILDLSKLISYNLRLIPESEL